MRVQPLSAGAMQTIQYSLKSAYTAAERQFFFGQFYLNMQEKVLKDEADISPYVSNCKQIPLKPRNHKWIILTNKYYLCSQSLISYS